MKDAIALGLGSFFGMIALAFILRKELRRAPDWSDRTAEGELRSEERRQKPEEGRN